MTIGRVRAPLLQRIAGDNFSLEAFHDASTGRVTEPLAKLILRSADIERRAAQPWLYKSLAELGEEEFVSASPMSYLFDGKSAWLRHAEEVFGATFRSIIWEESRGLVFYLLDEATYRKACTGDSPYDFLCRLETEGMLSQLKFSVPPRWASELFVFRPNYDAYRLFWDDPGDEQPADLKRKREAVWRETDRMVGIAARAVRVLEPLPMDGVVRLRDVADALVSGRDVEGSDATDYVTTLARIDNCSLWLLKDDVSQGPVAAQSTVGREWTLSLFNSYWWDDRLTSRQELKIAEQLSIKKDDAERLFPFIGGNDAASSALSLDFSGSKVVSDEVGAIDMDPSDLPPELDCAKQAYRAVQMGFGKRDSTFK